MGGELSLFSSDHPSDAEGAWTVARVTKRARQLVESGMRSVWVQGEVSGFKSYRSGHWYFTLRDEEAQVRCVMWRGDNARVKPEPEEGLKVFVEARPTVWEERGEFRLTVKRLIPTAAEGTWELQLRKAKEALEKDGLLDPARKRPLPEIPDRIAVITSPDGAALHDILNVLGRRWPAAEVFLVPTLVQGEGAVEQLCEALETLHSLDVDVAIVGRGGGSREDLWAFSDEKVARAVAASPVPIVSAVGHEEDIALTDLVADVRAPTPSAAAEAVVPDREEVTRALDSLAKHLGQLLTGRTRLARERLERTGDRIQGSIQRIIDRAAGQMAELAATLDALSPLKVLERGYSVARDGEGKVLSSVKDFVPGGKFRLTVSDGDIDAAVEEKSI